jgi:hypothetical protein
LEAGLELFQGLHGASLRENLVLKARVSCFYPREKLVMTLIYELRRRGLQHGLTTICMAVGRLPS